MGLFDKRSSFNPADLSVFDLEDGFVFEMNGKSYEVTKTFL